MNKPFTSCFASQIEEYVAFRHTMGVRSDAIESTLRRFDRYVAQTGHAGRLTLSLVTGFVCADGHASANTKGLHYQMLRHFADYLCIHDPRTERLPASLFRRPRNYPAPYIFTEEEITRLVASARKVSSRNPLRGHTLHAAVGLTACTGLRNGEVCRLERTDVDLSQGTIHIRNTKFGKSRRLPLHSTTVTVLSEYATARDRHFGAIDCPAFFPTMWRTHFAENTLHQAFRQACELAGICEWHGPGPRFHDLRHTFAVRRLAAWYREGADVQAMLPALATYMGHGHYTDTAWYLTAAAAHCLNHQIRNCLGRRTACEVFTAGSRCTMIDARGRKEVTDELIVMAAGYLELADDWRLVTAMKAWRLAVETWLLAHQAISVTPNRVSPTFRR